MKKVLITLLLAIIALSLMAQVEFERRLAYSDVNPSVAKYSNYVYVGRGDCIDIYNINNLSDGAIAQISNVYNCDDLRVFGDILAFNSASGHIGELSYSSYSLEDPLNPEYIGNVPLNSNMITIQSHDNYLTYIELIRTNYPSVNYTSTLYFANSDDFTVFDSILETYAYKIMADTLYTVERREDNNYNTLVKYQITEAFNLIELETIDFDRTREGSPNGFLYYDAEKNMFICHVMEIISVVSLDNGNMEILSETPYVFFLPPFNESHYYNGILDVCNYGKLSINEDGSLEYLGFHYYGIDYQGVFLINSSGNMLNALYYEMDSAMYKHYIINIDTGEKIMVGDCNYITSFTVKDDYLYLGRYNNFEIYDISYGQKILLSSIDVPYVSRVQFDDDNLILNDVYSYTFRDVYIYSNTPTNPEPISQIPGDMLLCDAVDGFILTLNSVGYDVYNIQDATNPILTRTIDNHSGRMKTPDYYVTILYSSEENDENILNYYDTDNNFMLAYYASFNANVLYSANWNNYMLFTCETENGIVLKSTTLALNLVPEVVEHFGTNNQMFIIYEDNLIIEDDENNYSVYQITENDDNLSLELLYSFTAVEDIMSFKVIDNKLFSSSLRGYCKTIDLYSCPFLPTENNEHEVVKPELTLTNYPNPFNPETQIDFMINTKDNVKLEIYNLKGQKVKTLLDGVIDSGTHKFIWDGRNDSNQRVASGIYFYRVVDSAGARTRKMILMK